MSDIEQVAADPVDAPAPIAAASAAPSVDALQARLLKSQLQCEKYWLRSMMNERLRLAVSHQWESIMSTLDTEYDRLVETNRCLRESVVPDLPQEKRKGLDGGTLK